MACLAAWMDGGVESWVWEGWREGGMDGGGYGSCNGSQYE